MEAKKFNLDDSLKEQKEDSGCSTHRKSTCWCVIQTTSILPGGILWELKEKVTPVVSSVHGKCEQQIKMQ